MEHKVRRRWVSLTLKCAFSVLFILIQKGSIDQGARQVATPEIASYSTALGEHKSIAMEDGSELVLNTSSIASVEITKGSRSVAIHHGEALLNVAADPRKLVVHLATIDLETGAPARAHLRLDPDGTTRVDMLEGEGWVRPAGAATQSATVLGRFQPIHVKAGSSFSLHYDVRIVEQLDASEVSRRLAWTQGRVILAGESLRDAVAEFNRYNRRQLIIGDESVANLPTGGTFDATEIDTFVRSLHQLFHVRAVRMHSGDTAADVVMLVGTGYSGL